ncbi:MAG: hypothetical protein KF745_11695 [Phycisphaeraceae bacterium]|nr:hypothetical protein [Phycisphaeraceae bacterium]
MIQIGTVALAGALLAACDVPERSRRPAVAGQGFAAGAIVLAPEAVPEVDEYSYEDASRRDGALAVREGATGPLLASQEWPQSPGPSITDSWYVFYPSQPQTSVYFLRPYERYRPRRYGY